MTMGTLSRILQATDTKAYSQILSSNLSELLCRLAGCISHVYTVLVIDFLLEILCSLLAQNDPARYLTELRLHHFELHRIHSQNIKEVIADRPAKAADRRCKVEYGNSSATVLVLAAEVLQNYHVGRALDPVAAE